MLDRRLVMKIVATLIMAATALSGMAEEELTPMLLSVHDAPVPFRGSDGRMHLVYELWLTNFSSAKVTVEEVEVLGDGVSLQTLDAAGVGSRLQAAGQRESSSELASSAVALLFLHVVLPGDAVPRQLSHRLAIHADAAPPGHQEMQETGGAITVDARAVAEIAPPLSGEGYLSADSCCDATRHTRAALPVNGRVWISQRFAVDWEQLDSAGRIYNGPGEKLESYTIFGKPILAVADGTVASVVDGQPEQLPGKYPAGISIAAADGNSVILKLGEERYALYAHMQPGTIKVSPGERVKRGQVLGLVGNRGNSVAPHLHFQMIDRPISLGANGLPYAVDNFVISAVSPGTRAFDEAEEKGTPLAVEQIASPRPVLSALPLDQLVIRFVQK